MLRSSHEYPSHTPQVNSRATGQENPGNKGDTRFVNIAPRLKFFGDRLVLGMSWEQWKMKDANAKNDTWDLVGIGNLPFGTLSAGFSRYDNGAYADGSERLLNGSHPKFDRYFAGAKVPFGNFTTMTSYVYSKDKNDAGLKAQQFALGGRYALSKRTGFYAVWSRILADNAVGDYGGGYDVADSSTPGYGYRTGLNAGITHSF